MAAGLPEPACRWLTHAIVPGTPLARAVIVEMEGHIRLGRWLPFRAVQLHAPPDGYVWAARARLGPLRISGFDRFAGDTGEMRWRLLGHIPVVNATGPDLDRSAAGRVALDAMLVPTAFLNPLVNWSDGPRPDSATAEWTVGARTLQTELGVGPDGELRSVVMPRWGNPHGHPWGEYPCGGILTDEVDFGGIKLPSPDAGRVVLRYRSLGRRRVLPRSDHQGCVSLTRRGSPERVGLSDLRAQGARQCRWTRTPASGSTRTFVSQDGPAPGGYACQRPAEPSPPSVTNYAPGQGPGLGNRPGPRYPRAVSLTPPPVYARALGLEAGCRAEAGRA